MQTVDDILLRIAAMPPGPEQDLAASVAFKMYGAAPKKTTNVEPMEKYSLDPDGYFKKYFGWEVWSGIDERRPGQKQIFEAIVLVVRQQLEKRDFENGKVSESDLVHWKPGQVIKNWIRVESGNGIGKTKSLAGGVNWAVDCFRSIVYTFHTSAKQDALTTWKEIRKDRRGKGLPGRILDTALKLTDDRFAESRTTSDSHGKGEEKIKGQHNEYLFFFIDEADGVEDYVFDGIETMESGGISVVVMMANPRSRSSRFHRIKKHSYVQTLRISSLYHPNVVEGRDVIPGAVKRDFVEKQIEKKCKVVDKHDPERFTFELPYDVRPGGVLRPAGTIFEPEPEFMWTVLGIAPPTSLDKTVISTGVYEAACKREPLGGDVKTARVGVDCARSGKDSGTVYIQWQDIVYRTADLFHQETQSYVDSIKTECLKLKEKGVTSLHIRVDAGYGSGVIDALAIDAELKEAFEDFQVFEVHFGSTAYNQKNYDNLITELYYEAAETLRGLSIIEPPDPLEIDLTEREFKFINRKGKTRKILEPKEDFTKRAKRSPDDGDGLVLAIGPDYCFRKVSVEIVSGSGTKSPALNKTSVVDDLASRLGLRSKPTGERVLIIGWPGTGKTTLAAEMGGGRSTDELISLGWSGASEEASRWFDAPGPWIIEGVAIPRALRKWRERNPGKRPPVDRIIRLTKLQKELQAEAVAMGKGLDTIYAEIQSWLNDHVKIEVR